MRSEMDLHVVERLQARVKELELRVETEVHAYLDLCDKVDRYRKALEKITRVEIRQQQGEELAAIAQAALDAKRPS